MGASPKKIGPFMVDVGVGKPFVYIWDCILSKGDEGAYVCFLNVLL